MTAQDNAAGDRRQLIHMASWFVVTVIALSALGCDAFFNEVFVKPTPERDLRGRAVLVVPFAEGETGWYGDTANGVEFARGLAGIVNRECSRTTIPSTPAASCIFA